MTDHITLPRSTVERAIEALEYDTEPEAKYGIRTAIEILRAALAAQQAEPVPVGQVQERAREAARVQFEYYRSVAAPQPAQPVAVPQVTRNTFDGVVPTAIRGYLRRCSSGGMPKKHIDIVQANVDEAERLGYFRLSMAEAILSASPTPPAATVPGLEPLTEAQIDEEWFYSDGAKLTTLQRARNFARAVEAAHAAKLAKLNGITPPAGESV